jgi:hypothetical protein
VGAGRGLKPCVISSGAQPTSPWPDLLPSVLAPPRPGFLLLPKPNLSLPSSTNQLRGFKSLQYSGRLDPNHKLLLIVPPRVSVLPAPLPAFPSGTQWKGKGHVQWVGGCWHGGGLASYPVRLPREERKQKTSPYQDNEPPTTSPPPSHSPHLSTLPPFLLWSLVP